MRIRRHRYARSRAAVAVVLHLGPDGDEILLTRRAARAGDPWSGHVSFPGGRAEAHDASMLETAVRETREELGVDLRGRHVGRLGAHLTREHNSWWPMAIDPFLFRLDARPQLVLNHEVAEAFWVSLRELRSGGLDTRRPWRLGWLEVPMPAWDKDGRTIWGLTYGMIQELMRS